MNAAQKAVYINAQAVAMMAEISGMQAENQHRLNVGQSIAYGDEAFIALAEKYGLTEARMKAFFDQPTPAPEPPLCACGHSKREHEVFGVCQGSECGCMGYEKPEPPAPNPAMVEFYHRLASFWPKAGQVPSVADIKEWFDTDERESIQYRQMKAIRLQSWLLSRMGQPAKPDKLDCDNCDVTDLRPVQPSPVTAEKLAEWTLDHPIYQYYDRLEYTEAILKFLGSQPTLGQGRLTRDDPRVKEAVEKFLKEANYSPGPLFRTLITDLLALQGPMTVSKAQWEKLESKLAPYCSGYVFNEFAAWLKDELGMEVQE